MQITQNDYSVGSIVEYVADGDTERRRVRVDSKSADIKNGRPGFDGVELHDDGEPAQPAGWGVWGYDEQIVGVVRR